VNEEHDNINDIFYVDVVINGLLLGITLLMDSYSDLYKKQIKTCVKYKNLEKEDFKYAYLFDNNLQNKEEVYMEEEKDNDTELSE